MNESHREKGLEGGLELNKFDGRLNLCNQILNVNMQSL